MKINSFPRFVLALVALALVSFALSAPGLANTRASNKYPALAAEQAVTTVTATSQQADFKLRHADTLTANHESKTTISESIGFIRPPLVATRRVPLPPIRAVSAYTFVSRARKVPLKLLMNRFRGQADPPLNC
jgi:hypothetical protein